jgi:selenocysteine lyase/cysteine desulfurase
MMEGLRFHQGLGSEAIFSRIHHLAKTVRAHALQSPQVELLTPDDDQLYSALVTVTFRGKDPKPLFQACRQKRIWVMQSDHLRISTHIHTRPSDIEAFFDVLSKTKL